jgi:hypothetical protein
LRRTAQGNAAFDRFFEMTFYHLEYGVQLCIFRIAQPDRAFPADPGMQEDGQQFRVGQ